MMIVVSPATGRSTEASTGSTAVSCHSKVESADFILMVGSISFPLDDAMQNLFVEPGRAEGQQDQ